MPAGVPLRAPTVPCCTQPSAVPGALPRILTLCCPPCRLTHPQLIWDERRIKFANEEQEQLWVLFVKLAAATTPCCSAGVDRMRALPRCSGHCSLLWQPLPHTRRSAAVPLCHGARRWRFFYRRSGMGRLEFQQARWGEAGLHRAVLVGTWAGAARCTATCTGPSQPARGPEQTHRIPPFLPPLQSLKLAKRATFEPGQVSLSAGGCRATSRRTLHSSRLPSHHVQQCMRSRGSTPPSLSRLHRLATATAVPAGHSGPRCRTSHADAAGGGPGVVHV